jgi:hypothetical protein
MERRLPNDASSMQPRFASGEFEFQILATLLAHPRDAYGVSLRDGALSKRYTLVFRRPNPSRR